MLIKLDELNRRLDALEAHLLELVTCHPTEGDFWAAFLAVADRLEEVAGAHAEAVGQRLVAMLAWHGRYIAYVTNE